MKSAHALAVSELEQTREKNRRELERRRKYVREHEPILSEIEAKLMEGGNALLRCVLNGGRDFENIKKFIQKKQSEKQELLESMGLPKDYLDEIYDCQNCHDTGFDSSGRKCSCLVRLTAKYIDLNSNMTELMKSQTFENFDFSLYSPNPDGRKTSPLEHATKAYNIAKSFADDFSNGRNIILMGNAGTGKTYLSNCIGNRALARGKTVYYQTSYKLFELLENLKFGKYDDSSEYDRALSIKKYVYSADLLIIDDLGTEFVTQFTAAALFDLINTRLLDSKATVISTNLSLESMEKMYSTRFTSRIFGEFKMIFMYSEDLRKKKINS